MRLGMIKVTYDAITDRGIKYLRQSGFEVMYVMDYPEYAQVWFVGSHPSMVEICEGDIIPEYWVEFTVEEKYRTGEEYSQVEVRYLAEIS